MRSFARSPLDWLLIAGIAGALFLCFYDPAMLDVRNVAWLLRGTDNGENALGLHAWLRAADGFRTPLLNAPDGVSILFTDSNPLLAALVRPFAPGGDFQVVGPMFLLCLLLHIAFARALLAPYARSAFELWAGVLMLSLLPTLFVRQEHANLSAHWLILWALWIFAEPRRAGDWRWWLAILGVATAIHSYLLAIVAAIWGTALLERFVAGAPRRRPALVLGAVAGLGLVSGIMAMLIDHGAIASTGTYGRFGMPIDAPWNPALPGLSTFLPAHPQAADRQMEAFQYLGAGLLLLIAAAPLIAWRTRTTGAVAVLHRRLAWLVPVLVALTLIAISRRVDFAGETLLTVPMSRTALALADPVRASARLFWPVAYVLALWSVTSAWRLSRARAALLLGAALLVQALDLMPLSAMMRHDAAVARDRVKWRRTPDPRWASVIAGARDVTFMPPDATKQLDLFQEIAWRAIDAGRPVRLVYAARTNAATAARLAREERDFTAGRLVPGRLYILLPEAAAPANARVTMLDGVRVIPPTLRPATTPPGLPRHRR